MTTDLVTQQTGLAPISLPEMFKLGEMLVTTGFLPKAVDTPAKCVAIMLKGQELGVPPMYALNNIAIVNGKQVCQAELMLSMIYRDHGSQAVQFLETNDRVCRLRYQRRGGEPGEFAFTLDDADAAGLLTKPGPPGGVAPWKGYRPAMLRARAISAMARLAFPDTIAGMYTPEEMGARVVVTADGEVVMDEEPEATERPALPPSDPESRPLCEQCGSEIKETQFKDGTIWSALQLEGYGRRKHGKSLCLGHYRAANETARQAGRSAAGQDLTTAPAPARSYDGETMKPPAPDPLGADRVARERLTKAFGKVLADCAAVGYPVEELNLAEVSNQELAAAINELTKRLATFKADSGADLTDDEAAN